MVRNLFDLFPTKDDKFSTDAPKSKALKTLVRLGISILVLTLILYKLVDRRQLLDQLSRLSTQGVILIIFVYTLGQMLSAEKWKIFITQANISRSYISIMRAYFLGMFINTFGLGTVGGDVARAVLINPEKGKRAAALASVVADRIHGLCVLLSIGTLASIFVRPQVVMSWIYPCGTLSIPIMLVCWVYGPRILSSLVPDTHRWKQPAMNAAQAFITSPRPFTVASTLSILFHFSQIYLHTLILAELNTSVPFWYLVATVPFVNVLCSLPISMNGIGLREGLYIFFFSALGLSRETSVAMGLIWVFTITVISAASGLIFGVIYNLIHSDEPN